MMEHLLNTLNNLEHITVKPQGVLKGLYIVELHNTPILSFKRYNSSLQVFPYASYFENLSEQIMSEAELIEFLKSI